MNRILHILREPHSPVALELIREEGKNSHLEVLILLIQEAVRKEFTFGDSLKVYMLKEDLEERGLSPPKERNITLIDYPQMLDLLYRADKIVTW